MIGFLLIGHEVPRAKDTSSSTYKINTFTPTKTWFLDVCTTMSIYAVTVSISVLFYIYLTVFNWFDVPEFFDLDVWIRSYCENNEQTNEENACCIIGGRNLYGWLLECLGRGWTLNRPGPYFWVSISNPLHQDFLSFLFHVIKL